MKIVKVIWVDAETVGDCNWQDFNEIKLIAKNDPPLMQSVGFVLHDCESHISIVDSVGEEDCGHLTKIPKKMIKEVVELSC
jgi:hypothetical protein